MPTWIRSSNTTSAFMKVTCSRLFIVRCAHLLLSMKLILCTATSNLQTSWSLQMGTPKFVTLGCREVYLRAACTWIISILRKWGSLPLRLWHPQFKDRKSLYSCSLKESENHKINKKERCLCMLGLDGIGHQRFAWSRTSTTKLKIFGVWDVLYSKCIQEFHYSKPRMRQNF